MGTVGEPGGVEGDHAPLDVVPAEEIPGVVEEHLVVVVVAVVEGHLEGTGSLSMGRGTKVQTTNRLATKVE